MGDGAQSAESIVSVTPSVEGAIPSTTPAAPASLNGRPGNSEVTLSWPSAVPGSTTADDATRNRQNGFSPITSYWYRQKTGDGDYSPWAIIIDSGPITASYTVKGLTNGNTYQFQVRARNANGPGAATESRPVTIATTPGRPRSLNAAAGNGQVTLTWTASSNGGLPITSWQFRLSEGENEAEPAAFADTHAWVTIPNSGADTTSYTVVSLDNTSRYMFQVRAVNALGAGSSAQSSVVNPGEPPGAPTGFTGTAEENFVTLAWDAPDSTPTDNADEGTINNGGSPIIRYEYSQKTGDGDYGEWVAVPTTSIPAAQANTAGDKSHIVRGLTPGTAYQFRVRAVNETGPGPVATMRAPVYPGTKPLAPANLNASPVYDAASGSASVTLSWRSGGDGGSPITQWQYRTATTLSGLTDDAASSWVVICDNTEGADPTCASKTSVTLPRPGRTPGTVDSRDTTLDTALKAGLNTQEAAADPDDDEHHFIIRAFNAHDPGFSSGTDSARFGPSVPSAPRSVYITATGPAADPPTISLWWTASVPGGAFARGQTGVVYQYSYRAGSGAWSGWNDVGTGTTLDFPQPAGTAPGTAFTFRIRAVNSVGAGAHTESDAVAIGAPGTPGAGTAGTAPVITALPGTTLVTLALTGTTGATVTASTRWEYSYKVGDGEYGNWAFSNVGDNLDIPGDANEIDGLQNGVSHTFRIRALNGPLSSPILTARPVTPGVAPPAPQGLTASAGDGTVTLSWTSGGSGGPAITRWEYCEHATQAEGAATPTETGNCGDVATPAANLDPAQDDVAGWLPVPRSGPDTNTHTIGSPRAPLTNGTAYTYMVRAVNVLTTAAAPTAGNGARAQANPATPGKAPSIPSRVIVDAGDSQVTITVDKPLVITNDPGRPVTGYQVRKSMNGGAYDAWESLGTSGRPPLTAESGVAVTGLTNGASYTFQVRAVNAFGPGTEITSSPVTPVGAPTGGMLGADPGDGQVALSWDSASSGGTAITKWQYRQSEAGGGYGSWTDIADSGPATTSHVVTGLDNGTSYTFQVRAVSQVGTGAPISSGAATPGTVPAAPSVNAARGNGQVDLSWTAGTAAGAAATTGWQVRTDDGEWMDVDGADTSSYSVTGLMNGTAYTFEVRAVNSFGAGEAGSASATPATTPSAPAVSAMRGDGSTSVSWTAGDDGGSAVTGWQVQVNGGGWSDVMADTMSLSVDTDDGTAYTIEVRGVNDVGEGAAGSASVEAGSTPAAPTVTATGGNGSITVSWTAGDDGGSSINAWHYRMKVSIGDYGDWNEASADTMSVTLSDLGSGTGVLSYTFQVRGVNGVGEGAAGTSNEASPVEAEPANGVYYSGVITGPDFCANLSLGGARLFSHDDDGDGVADVCSLPYTRREAIARQNAVEALAVQYASEYVRLVNAACAITEGDAACGGETLSAPPAVAINDGGPYYSGVITGPTYCANRSLGGPTTYPHDNDKDGVAEVCALPYSRREAIARQLAGDILAASYPSDFRRELASACRGLTGANYGDDPEDLGRDACA